MPWIGSAIARMGNARSLHFETAAAAARKRLTKYQNQQYQLQHRCKHLATTAAAAASVAI